VSTGDINPESTDGSADEPAALAPDDATAVHDVPKPAEPPAAPAEAPAPPAPPAPAVPRPETSRAEGVTPAAEAARVIEPAATVPSPDHQAASAAGVGPDPVQVTGSGLPNPHGLPEIAVERPEVALGAAFAGGLVLAMILKRFAR
jgi:hypothetical protein